MPIHSPLVANMNVQQHGYMLQGASDAELLILIQGGNRLAFVELVERHSSRFYRLAYRFTAHRETAEDIVQDAFLALWENPGSWRSGGNAKFTTWFYRIILNRATDMKRRPAFYALEYAQEQSEEGEQEIVMIQNEQQAALEREIQALPMRQQIALNLCFYEGVSNQDAAIIMDLNIKALESLLMRAKTTLKQRLSTLYSEG